MHTSRSENSNTGGPAGTHLAVLAALLSVAAPAFPHADSPGAQPVVPQAVPLRHRAPAEIVSLFAGESPPTDGAGHRSAHGDLPGSLIPEGVTAVLRERGTAGVIVVGQAGREEVARLVRMLDARLERADPGLVRTTLIPPPAIARQAAERIRRIPGGKARLTPAARLVLEGTPDWLHRAQREFIRVGLGLPAG